MAVDRFEVRDRANGGIKGHGVWDKKNGKWADGSRWYGPTEARAAKSAAKQKNGLDKRN